MLTVFITLIYVVVNFVIFSLFRSFIPSGIFTDYAGEFIATWLTHSNSFESGTIRRAYGYIAYILYKTILLSIYDSYLPSAFANTCGLFKDTLLNRAQTRRNVIKMFLQISGALLARYWAHGLWSMALSETHEKRYLNWYNGCQTDLVVPVIVGMVMEFSAVVFYAWMSSAISGTSLSARWQIVLCNVCGSTMDALGVELTGMYWNPTLALVMHFWCDGLNWLQFFLIYWLSPLAGVYVSTMTPLRAFPLNPPRVRKLSRSA